MSIEFNDCGHEQAIGQRTFKTSQGEVGWNICADCWDNPWYNKHVLSEKRFELKKSEGANTAKLTPTQPPAMQDRRLH